MIGSTKRDPINGTLSHSPVFRHSRKYRLLRPLRYASGLVVHFFDSLNVVLLRFGRQKSSTTAHRAHSWDRVFTHHVQERSGFTLIEAMVAAAISSILMISVVGIFVTFQKLQNSSHEELQLQVAARQVINTITEQLRSGYIDYAYYTAEPALEPQYLATRTPQGDQTVIEFYDDGSGMNVYVCKKTFDDSCAKGVDPNVDPDWSQLNTDDISFLKGSFTIQPSEAQFYTTAPSDEPQLVTVRMKLTTVMSGVAEESLSIQTTFTPRVYAR